jgi:hypothetical protein
MDEQQFRNNHTDIALIKQDILYIKERVDAIGISLSENYVTRREFDLEVTPLKRIVYGMVGLILTSVACAMLLLVLGGVR